MDDEITEYRVRLLKFNEECCGETRAANKNIEPLTKKSSARCKNVVKIVQPEGTQAYRIVAGQPSHTAEEKRSPDNQVNEKYVNQVQMHQHCPKKSTTQKKPRSTIFQFPTKSKNLQVLVGVFIHLHLQM